MSKNICYKKYKLFFQNRMTAIVWVMDSLCVRFFQDFFMQEIILFRLLDQVELTSFTPALGKRQAGPHLPRGFETVQFYSKHTRQNSMDGVALVNLLAKY